MKDYTGLTRHVTEEIFEAAGEEQLSLWDQLRISLHLFFCPRCSEEAQKLELLHEIMNTDFFPPCADFGERVMEKINAEEGVLSDVPGSVSQVPGGFSTRGWIITGCFLVLSLATVFFGLDFIEVADAQGSSFLLPIGLTIGLILTGYVALFIGSHLHEFSTRFRLH